MSDRDTEAAHWFAAMRAPGAETDRDAFEAWHADPANAEAYARAKDDWLLVGGVAPEHLAVHRPKTASPTSSPARWALAAALVLTISLAFAWTLLGNRDRDPIMANVASGEMRLEDGTRVELTDGARVETRFSKAERRVLLTGGRARFTVAHDAARPFRVVAAGSETIALGTIFEVDLTGRRPVIRLIEGSVEVRATVRPGPALRLLPGQSAAVENDAPTLVDPAEKRTPAAMSSPVGSAAAASLLDADELPLGAVVDQANRVSAARIELADSKMARRLVSGRFDVADARSLARKLAVALDLTVEERSGNFVLTPK